MLITNIDQECSLLTRLGHLVAEIDELRVLVGFFYFWGVSALHGGFVRNKEFQLKIFVGLEAEDHAGAIVEYAGTAGAVASDEDRRKDFLAGLCSVMRGKEIDTQVYCERVSLFIDLLRSGQIEIRKTREPSHAKLYHFTLKLRSIKPKEPTHEDPHAPSSSPRLRGCDSCSSVRIRRSPGRRLLFHRR